MLQPKEVPIVVPKFKVPESSNDSATPLNSGIAKDVMNLGAPESFMPGNMSVGVPSAIPNASDKFSNCADGALHWYKFGFDVIPIISHNKVTALTWDQWLYGLSLAKISLHWNKCSFHDLGFIVGDEIIVFDADSPESAEALVAIENLHGLKSNLVVKTSKGEHHYFKRAKGTFAKSDAHSTKDHPDRLDVKTGRAMVILPPSIGKSIVICEAQNASELIEIGQDFIDAVFIHNGRAAPRQADITPLSNDCSASPTNNIERLKVLLNLIDPDGGGYQNWLNGLMAIFHETVGSEEGFRIAVSWSERGRSYKGEKEIRTKWNSFKSGTSKPITIATLFKMAKDNGADLSSINGSAGEHFEKCETVVIMPNVKSAKAPVESDQPVAENTVIVDADKQLVLINPLDQYSLKGKSGELEKQALDDVFVLLDMALLGQLTVFYAWPNTGKTLLILYMLIDSIKCGRIDPAKLYYLNMDDSHKGLIEKLRLAEEFGFNMLADGYEDFSTGKFVAILLEMIETNSAHGVIIVLDTLKKFTDVMDKQMSSKFAKVIRKFSLKGGTVIALAHANKKANAEGKPIPGGTSDIKDDIDCAYVMWALTAESGTSKVIQFEKSKSRGSVVETAAYSYSTERGITYSGLLASVQPVDDTQLESLKQAEATKSDAEVIGAITTCINAGINSKMKLADAVRERTGISRNSALQVIERYEGVDTATHRWTCSIGARGVMLFTLLPIPQPEVNLEHQLDKQPTPDDLNDCITGSPVEPTPDSSEDTSTPEFQRASVLTPPVKIGEVSCAEPSGYSPIVFMPPEEGA
jgi:hypothetical protein